MKHQNQSQQTAFTLLEVLVALFILSVGLVAAISASIEITRNTHYLQNKTLAHWVAQNVLSQYTLDNNTQRRTEGVEKMADQSWDWRINTASTVLPGVNKVTVQVSLNQQKLATLQQYENQLER